MVVRNSSFTNNISHINTKKLMATVKVAISFFVLVK